MIYRFDDCELDTATQELRRAGELVAVEPQVFAVIEYLLTHPDRVVTKIELLDEVWGDRFVSEAALTSRIKLARQACGDSGREQRIIKTVHGRGYRMVATVTQRGSGAPSPPAVDAGPAAIGREAEMARLGDAVAAVAAGSPATVFVLGPAGVGKSTLVADVLERSDDLDGWLVLQGRCHRSRSGPEPYFALLDALASLADQSPDLLRDTLDRVAPSWLVQFPTLVDDELAARLHQRLLGGARQRMLREGADALGALTRHQPTMLVLEDLHQADDCTLDLLEFVVDGSAAGPLLVVATVRPGSAAVDDFVAQLVTTGAATTVELGPLDRDAIGRLLAERHPDRTLDDDLVDLVHRRCDGNPLFAQELFTAWDAAGLADGGAGPVEERHDELLATVPTGLVALIDRSLSALDDDEREVLEAAAAAGPTFEAASVAAGLDGTLADAETALAHMARRPDHISPVGATTWTDGTVSTSYTFSHQLYRDVVHDRLNPGRRAELHRRIGLALEARHREADEATAALADHFVAAGDHTRAARYQRRLAVQALGRQAPGAAESVLRTALDHSGQVADGPERDRLELAIRITAAEARVGVAGWADPEVTAHYERALELATALGAGEEEANARYGLATISEMHGDFERTETLLAPLITTDDATLEMEAHELVACSTFHQGAFDRSRANADAVLRSTDDDETSAAMARVAEHPATSCNSWMSLSNWFLGRSDESLRRAENAVRLGERHRYALAMATQQRAMLHQLRGEVDECLEWADRTRALDREVLSRVRLVQAEVFRGWALAAADDGELDTITAAMDRFRRAGIELNAPYYLSLHAEALINRGRPTEALALLDEAEAILDRTTPTYFHRPEMIRLRAAAELAVDPTAIERARMLLDDSIELAWAMGSPAAALRSTADRVELEQGATEWVERLRPLVDRYDGQVPPPDVVRGRQLLG